ncbi:MAG: transposase [Casimicrobium sp.]
MSHFRRSYTAGGTYFFTVVTYRRQRFLCDEDVRTALRDSIRRCREAHPFDIDAWVLLPDHMHCIWTLPEGDADFSTRWNVIKRGVTRRVGARLERADLMNESKAAHRESTLWQRRFWEHQIRDDADFRAHMDYVHFNPVKHGLVDRVADWPHSSFHRFVANGTYTPDWASPVDSTLLVGAIE